MTGITLFESIPPLPFAASPSDERKMSFIPIFNLAKLTLVNASLVK